MLPEQTGSNPEVETAASSPETNQAAEPGEGNSASTQHSTGTRRLRRLAKGADESSVRSRVVARRNAKSDPPRIKIKTAEDFVDVSLADDRYVVKSQLGKGSMAYVFLAADRRLETDVVVKVPKPEKFTTLDFRDRFKKECQLLVRFSHPHVVGVLDVGEYEQLPYVVMQLLSGGSLADRLKNESNEKGQMAPETLKGWVGGVARALDFCARKGMIHRDVKPANILFDADQNPYVSDFGLSKVMYGDHVDLNSSETAAGAVLGTPNYIAPEIVLGKPYDGRADQYSLGISVYHTLLGRPPMQGGNATATMINQTTKQLQLLSDIRSDVSRELALAIRKSIEKRPENRFATCEEFAEAVIEALRGPAVQATAPVADPLPMRPTKKKKRPASITSSQSSMRGTAPKKKKRSARSAAASSSSSSTSGRSDKSKSISGNADADWLNLASEGEVFLPPKKGKPSTARKKTKKKKSGAAVMAMTAGAVVLLGLLVAYLVIFPGS